MGGSHRRQRPWRHGRDGSANGYFATNGYTRWSTPYGGVKASGWGRENGIEGLDPFLETWTTVISTTGTFADPFAN